MSQAARVLVLLIGVLFFLSPVVPWVAAIEPAWWWPFAAWAVFVGLIALTMLGRRDP
jgi:di/tricarboxylate transporter